MINYEGFATRQILNYAKKNGFEELDNIKRLIEIKELDLVFSILNFPYEISGYFLCLGTINAYFIDSVLSVNNHYTFNIKKIISQTYTEEKLIDLYATNSKKAASLFNQEIFKISTQNAFNLVIKRFKYFLKNRKRHLIESNLYLSKSKVLDLFNKSVDYVNINLNNNARHLKNLKIDDILNRLAEVFKIDKKGIRNAKYSFLKK